MKLLIMMIFVTTLVSAKNDLTHRPRSFSTGQGRAVFVDFISADYEITYNADKRAAFVVAKISFDAPEEGLPVFDSIESPQKVLLDGQDVTVSEISTPSRETTLRYVNRAVTQGRHLLEVSVPLTTLVEFSDGGVKSAFWTSDLSERRFLERYMPASFEYDQVKMTFNIFFDGNKKAQKIFSNGVVREKRSNGRSFFTITFPDYFNSSSVFYHTVPEGSVDEIRFNLRSIDGREIPAVVYAVKSIMGDSLARLRDEASGIFHELEGDYGPWPHPTLVVYNAGTGGMEYCGATMTSASALGHEMFHSYFARALMPANGNSGWIDEALASWRDDGYLSATTLSGTSKMSNRPYYTRSTDYSAYSFGERFMRFMDGKHKEKGGLRPFLRFLVEKRKFAPLFVEEFIDEMSTFYGVDVGPDFKRYTYGTVNSFPSDYRSPKLHIHSQMTIEELKTFL
jgi:hypothetical protein